MEHKSRRERRLKFRYGGNLRGFPRELNFVCVCAQYKRVYFSLTCVLRMPPLCSSRVRAVHKRALKARLYTAQYGGICRGRKAIVMTSNSCIKIIHIGSYNCAHKRGVFTPEL